MTTITICVLYSYLTTMLLLVPNLTQEQNKMQLECVQESQSWDEANTEKQILIRTIATGEKRPQARAGLNSHSDMDQWAPAARRLGASGWNTARRNTEGKGGSWLKAGHVPPGAAGGTWNLIRPRETRH